MIRGVFVLTLVGCASHAPSPPTARPASSAPTDAGTTGPTLLSFDDLAARGARAAPLMREHARVNGSTTLTAKEADSCFRVVVSTAGSFEGRPDTAGDTFVPPNGPICLKKGQSMKLVTEGRALVLVAP